MLKPFRVLGLNDRDWLAGVAGLEPTTSGFGDRRSAKLELHPSGGYQPRLKYTPLDLRSKPTNAADRTPERGHPPPLTRRLTVQATTEATPTTAAAIATFSADRADSTST